MEISKVKEYENKVLEDFDTLMKDISDYFHKCGDGHGMDIKYDFFKPHSEIDDLKKRFSKVFDRVRRHIETENNMSNTIDDKPKRKSRFDI